MAFRFGACALALALFASGCGGGDESAESDTPAGAEQAETVVLEAVATPEPTAVPTAEPTVAPDDPPTPEPEPTPELTASFRGVTADAIKVGFTSVDFETLNNNFGLNLNFVGGEAAVDALMADLNARGGIGGRQVDYLFEKFLPVGATTSEVVCTKLTDDEEVFVVLNGFQGPGAEEVNLCITNVGETILMGGRPTAELADRAETLWLGRQMMSDREALAFTTLLHETGELENLGPIAVIGMNSSMSETVSTVAESIQAFGGEVPLATSIASTPGDEIATRGEADIIIERMRADGVGAALLIGNGAFVPKQFMTTAPEITLLNSDAASVAEVIRETPGSENVRYLSSGMTETQLFEHPLVQDCLDIVLAAEPDLVVVHPDDLTDADPNWAQAIVQRCQEVRLLETVLTAAGPNLTNDSVTEAALALGEFAFPGFPVASVRPDKLDVPDTVTLFEWDSTARDGAGGWMPISDTVAVR